MEERKASILPNVVTWWIISNSLKVNTVMVIVIYFLTVSFFIISFWNIPKTNDIQCDLKAIKWSPCLFQSNLDSILRHIPFQWTDPWEKLKPCLFVNPFSITLECFTTCDYRWTVLNNRKIIKSWMQDSEKSHT